MVRLVYRPYTQVWRSICTSEPLRASTRVSPGFTLLKYSSPSFGSYQPCFCSFPSQKIRDGRYCRCLRTLNLLSLRLWVFHPQTRMSDRLLGPCFKTGRLQSSRQNHLPVPQAPLSPSSETPLQGLSQISFDNSASFCPLIRKSPLPPRFSYPTFYVSK